MTLRVSALTRRLASYVGKSGVEIAADLLRECPLDAESVVGVVADPVGDWLEALLVGGPPLRLHHLATSPAEQAAAQARARACGRYDAVHWDALKLPSQPNPAALRFDPLLCGLHGGRLHLPEFFDWARRAVAPGGQLIATLEAYRGGQDWEARFTRYRRLRARYLERAPELDEQSFPTRDDLIARLQDAGFERILLRALHPPRPLAWTEFIAVTAR
jgi:hypothetical protein